MSEQAVMSEESAMQQSVDLLIVGSGLVGSAMAVLLAQQPETADCRIAVVEPVPFKPIYSEQHYDPRAVALTEQARGLLENLGVWQSIAGNRCCRYTDMVVRDSEGTGVIEFAAADVQQSNLGHIIENSVIVEQLLAQIAEQPTIDFSLSRAAGRFAADCQLWRG